MQPVFAAAAGTADAAVTLEIWPDMIHAGICGTPTWKPAAARWPAPADLSAPICDAINSYSRSIAMLKPASTASVFETSVFHSRGTLSLVLVPSVTAGSTTHWHRFKRKRAQATCALRYETSTYCSSYLGQARQGIISAIVEAANSTTIVSLFVDFQVRSHK